MDGVTLCILITVGDILCTQCILVMGILFILAILLMYFRVENMEIEEWYMVQDRQEVLPLPIPVSDLPRQALCQVQPGLRPEATLQL